MYCMPDMSGFGVYQELARELVCPKSLLVAEPRRDRKATRPKSAWLFPFFGTKGKRAWWNKHECNTAWKNMKDGIRHGIDIKSQSSWLIVGIPNPRPMWLGSVWARHAHATRKTSVSGD